MTNFKDIAGQKFGRLIAIKPVGKQNNHYVWQCKCICGRFTTIVGTSLTKEITKSCGCIAIEMRGKTALKHGFTKQGAKNTRFYNIFNSIKKRCKNPKDTSFKYYGARGIRCLWKSFKKFKNDMYALYLEHIKKFGVNNTQIDRVNNNKHYSKKNCRWATRSEQCRNRKNNTFITFNNQTKTLQEWAELYKIHRSTLQYRYKKAKWPIEKVFAK